MKTLATCFALAFCLPAVSQTPKAITSPDGFEKSEGSAYAYRLGYYPNHSQQLVDGEHRGTARVMTGIQMRRDSTYTATTYSNGGRAFTNVTITMGDADYDKVTTSFAGNIANSTVVFSAAYSMPSLTGAPLIKNPAIWGGVKGEFNFTFSKIWLYAAKSDHVTQWDFAGGKLTNGGTWSTYGSSYYLDGEYINTASTYVSGSYVPATRNTCNDSAITYTYGAYTYGYGYVYGKNGYIVNYRGKVFLATYSYYTAPGKPVLHAFGLPLSTGVNAGAKCNLLYINTLAPMLLVPFTAIEGDATGTSGTYYHVFDWHPILSNLQFTLQGAWSDSSSGQFALTAGMRMQFPKGPPPDKLPKRASIYQSGSTSSGLTNYLAKGTDGYITPLHRFLHK